MQGRSGYRSPVKLGKRKRDPCPAAPTPEDVRDADSVIGVVRAAYQRAGDARGARIDIPVDLPREIQRLVYTQLAYVFMWIEDYVLLHEIGQRWQELELGGAPAMHGTSLLHLCTPATPAWAVDCLLELGADPNAGDMFRRPPLVSLISNTACPTARAAPVAWAINPMHSDLCVATAYEVVHYTHANGGPECLDRDVKNPCALPAWRALGRGGARVTSPGTQGPPFLDPLICQSSHGVFRAVVTALRGCDYGQFPPVRVPCRLPLVAAPALLCVPVAACVLANQVENAKLAWQWQCSAGCAFPRALRSTTGDADVPALRVLFALRNPGFMWLIEALLACRDYWYEGMFLDACACLFPEAAAAVARCAPVGGTGALRDHTTPFHRIVESPLWDTPCDGLPAAAERVLGVLSTLPALCARAVDAHGRSAPERLRARLAAGRVCEAPWTRRLLELQTPGPGSVSSLSVLALRAMGGAPRQTPLPAHFLKSLRAPIVA